jgi:anti-sigma factor RsiW
VEWYVPEHISVDELADAAEGLLDPVRTDAVSAHLDTCADCRATSERLARVSGLLAADPAPPMPVAVSRRLESVLAAEAERRAVTGVLDDRSVRPPREPKPSLGSFGAGLPHRRLRNIVLPVLAAAVTAAAVGFGGYLVSASAGLNEPPSTAAAINPSQLGSQALRIEESQDPGPHLFSRAWRCARGVTAGRITGLTSVSVDGRPALLVYTRADDKTYATIVTGCSVASPSAGPSAMLP